MTHQDLFGPDQSASPGFRLQRLELWNWGTFDSSDGRVHAITPEGSSTLLIGRNGTGKSTLVDALLTLLTPPSNRSYNVAAGSSGGKRERDEKTYIKGAYDQGSSSESHRAQTKFLRPDGGHFSVILGVFQNEHGDTVFTLAQLLYLDSQGATKRLFCWADSACSVEEHFSEIVTMDRLKGQLEARGLQVTGTYTDYGRYLRKRTGMGEKAMDIFNQAVAVKEINSLDDFIRDHMLRKRNWRDTVNKVLNHFDLLSEAHRALVNTRREVELLDPVNKRASAYQKALDRFTRAEEVQAALDPFFAQRTLDIAKPRQEEIQQSLVALVDQKDQIDRKIATLSDQETDLKVAIQSSANSRLQELERLIPERQREHAIRHEAATRTQHLLHQLELGTLPTEEERFQDLLGAARQHRARIQADCNQLEKDRDALHIELYRLEKERDDLKREFHALQKRQTQLPESHQDIRDRLCHSLGLARNSLPFAAELMTVRDDELAWESSLEKVLRTFALTLLVDGENYREVSRLIDGQRLEDHRGRGMRLHYERIDLSEVQRNHQPAPGDLINKLELRENHPLIPWLAHRLATRFDYHCCENVAQFQNHRGRALTVNRHVKHGFTRHEKDDRQHLANRSSYVLGWDNVRKLQYFREQIEVVENQLVAAKNRQASIKTTLKRKQDAMQLLQQLGETRFSAIDQLSVKRELEALETERAELIESDDALKSLKATLAKVQSELAEAGARRDRTIGDLREQEGYLKQAGSMIEMAEKNLAKAGETPPEIMEEIASHLGAELTLESLQAEITRGKEWAEKQVRVRLEDREKEKERVIDSLNRYLRGVPERQMTMEASVETLPDFLDRRDTLIKQDLPRHERRFKEHLNEKVTQEIALLNARLRNAAKEIEEKIHQLNQSLTSINSTSTSFMKLELIASKDREVQDFRQQLKSCLDGSFGSGDVADEDRYKVIAAFIKRIKEEARWRDRVIDVRRWFHFAVGEYDEASGEQLSYYTDSAGQSGGEKARLAFTILVAAIAYQYNIDPNSSVSERFHFVMVDEMFSKVDDKYSEYALNLFRRFGLQLLIVAPFDAKARITEPYVDHYLHVMKDRDRSQVYSMTSEEALSSV